MPIQNGVAEAQPVKAFDIATGLAVGSYDSIAQAANKLFIRHAARIHNYLNGTKNCTFKGNRRGVASYKTSIKYHFEKV